MQSVDTTSPDPAVARYEGFLAHDPANPLLLLTLGDMHWRAGRTDAALGCYERCLAAEPRHGVALGRIGNVLLARERYADAERMLRHALQAEIPLGIRTAGPVGALWHNLGLALYCQQRWADAAAAFHTAEQAGVTSADNARFCAYALHQDGHIDGAIDVCNRAAERHVGNTQLQGYLALLELDSGRLSQARERAARVLQDDPTNTDAAVVDGMWLAEQQDGDGARARFEQVVRAEPQNPRGWLGIGLAHLHCGEHLAAINALEQALVHLPGHVGTRVTLGWAYVAHRDLGGAERAFRKAIDTDRRFGEAHGGLAVTLLFQRRIGEARHEQRIAQRLDPNGFGAMWVRTALLAIDGKRAEGEAEMVQALNRPFGSDGRSVFDHVQLFSRRQTARGTPPLPPPAPPTPSNDPAPDDGG